MTTYHEFNQQEVQALIVVFDDRFLGTRATPVFASDHIAHTDGDYQQYVEENVVG